jgi:hypothetical protein
MLELDTRALLFDVDLNVLTFTHYVEDRFRDSGPVRVYADKPFRAAIVDRGGIRKTIDLYPFSPDAVERRNFAKLYDAFERDRGVRRDRIGNTALAMLSLRSFCEFAARFVAGGNDLYGPVGSKPRNKPTRGGWARRSVEILANEIGSGRFARDASAFARNVLNGPIKNRRERRLPPTARSELARDRQGLLSIDPGAQAVITAGIEWLCTAQDQSLSNEGGIARHYSLLSGWSTSYPETTGYAIPTLLDGAPTDDLRQRSRRMLDWLVSIQLAEGAFQGGVIGEQPVTPVVFNTGQILLGLSAGVRVLNDYRYVQSLHRAANWLVSVQDGDGCWRKFASPFASVPEHTYDTHVAWGLIEAARVTGEEAYANAAIANVQWAITHQRPNGWFGRCCLEKATEPLTHTLAYTLRGIIEAYRYTRDRVYLDAACKTADAVAAVVGSDGFLAGRWRSSWKPAVNSACLTGSAQMACCWLLLYRDTGKRVYLDCARAVNRYVRRTIQLEGPSCSRGGVKGSFPIDGDYGTFEYLNWAAKFMIDANRMEIEAASIDQ